MNSIVIDPQFAKDAGLSKDGSLILKVSQQRAFGTYDISARVFEVEQLNIEIHREQLVTPLNPGFKHDPPGLHHFHAARKYSAWNYKGGGDYAKTLLSSQRRCLRPPLRPLGN